MNIKFLIYVFVLSFLAFSSCDDSDSNNNTNNKNNTNNQTVTPYRTDCTVTLSLDAGNETSAKLLGDFNEWQTDAGYPLEKNGYLWTIKLTSNPDEKESGIILLPPGEYAYKFLLSDTDWISDPSNPLTIWDKTQTIENSLLIMPDCSTPLTEETFTTSSWEEKTIVSKFQVYLNGSRDAIKTVDATVYASGSVIPSSLEYNFQTGEGTITAGNLSKNKYKFEITVTDVNNHTFTKTYSAWMEEELLNWEDMILYSIFVDRFFDGDSSNNKPIEGLNELVNWNGGDWKGITQKIKSGFFSDLGITALWISTPMDNPDQALPGDCGQVFSGYHAYWPQASRTVENHFGTEDDLKELVAEAHKRGIRVLIDWAANHVYIEHALHLQYYGNPYWFNYPGSTDPDEFWKNKCGYLGWNEYALTCWFTEYLPDYNLKNQELVRKLTDDALWWIRTFDLDGFRIDATKHIRSNYLKLLRKTIDEQIAGITTPFYMVGENFLYDYSVINQKISEHELEGQFDFPLYGAIRTAFIPQNTDLNYLNSFVYNNFIDYQGITDLDWSKEGPSAHGTIMGNFLGNHDVERFTSVAAGQTNGDGCQVFNEPQVPQPADAAIYKRLGLGFAFLLTVRGLPVIYYGDEIGMAGVKDPDNRRPMVFDEAQLSSAQSELKDLVSRLNKTRLKYRALRTGSYDAFYGEASCLAYMKSLENEHLLVVIAGDAGCHADITIKSEYGFDDGTSASDVLYENNETVTIAGGTIRVDLEPLNVRIYKF